MDQSAIFAPMGALALLTLAILPLVPIRRVRAVRAARIGVDDFKFGESAAVPGDVAIPNRNYMSLLELPILFYMGSLMYFVAGKVDAVALSIAWAFVASRFIHSAIHLTFNAVRLRAMVFGLGGLMMTAYWVLFFVR